MRVIQWTDLKEQSHSTGKILLFNSFAFIHTAGLNINQ